MASGAFRPVGGQSVGVGRPPVRRPLSAGVGRGCRWPKASLGQVGLRWPVGGQWVASEGSGSPMGGRPFSGQWGGAVGVGGQWAKARPQWEAFGR